MTNRKEESLLDSARLKRLLREAVRSGQLRYTEHALSRMNERGFVFPDVERVLKNGMHDYLRDSQVGASWHYRLAGTTVDGKALAVVVDVIPSVVVITVID